MYVHVRCWAACCECAACPSHAAVLRKRPTAATLALSSKRPAPGMSEETDPGADADAEAAPADGADPAAGADYKSRVRNHFWASRTLLDRLDVNWCPRCIPKGTKGYNLKATCGSSISVRFSPSFGITMVASCQGPVKDVVPDQRSFGLLCVPPSDVNEHLWSCLSRLCPCGRKVWDPRLE